MRSAILFLAFLFFASACQTANTGEATDQSRFSEITFHTSPCFGSCPKISVHIDKNRLIEVSRQFYRGKVEPDTTGSGNFKGEITEGDYKKLLTLLEKIDWETINFPTVMCCDAPVRTFILSYNNKTYQFKSMTPPESTNELIDFLKQLASDKLLPRYGGELKFKEVADQEK